MDRLVSFALFFLFSWMANGFMVMNTRSPLVTRTGCRVVMTCGGFGTSIEWRRFGDQNELGTNQNQTIVSKETIMRDNMTYLIANATLLASPAINNERFSCFIFGSTEGRTITHQVQLRVEEKVVEIVPKIRPTFDISTYRIGDPITIGCSVQTCAERVTVQFLKGDQTIRSPITTTTTDPSAYNLVLTVTEGITGEYACKVDVESPMMKSDRNTFEIVGTPRPPVPTTRPPETTESSSGTDPTRTPPNNDKGAAAMATLSLSLTTLLLSVHLSWLCTWL